MDRKDHIDGFGALGLIGFSMLLGFNQVLVKLVNDGMQPVFFAGIRSLGAVFCLWLWMRLRGRRVVFERQSLGAGILIGLIFAAEFIFLFLALDLTTVTRTSVIFYSMPVWLAVAAHFLLPNERITRRKGIGLVVAFGGVAWAILDRSDGNGSASLAGDLCALAAAICWAGIALCARGTALVRVKPDMQLFYQVGISAPVMLLISPLFGPLLRDLQPIHLWALAFQIVVIVTFGFIFWLWLLSLYPASSVASFSFLSPVFGVFMGWLLLDETIGMTIIGSLVLVAVGIVLVNTRPRGQAILKSAQMGK